MIRVEWGWEWREVQEGRDICILMVDLHLKLTQHCKATILYFKIYIFKKDAVINLHIPKSRWGDFFTWDFFF